MTIKSLLLGSAAVLVAATGARAADAIVAEPEPVEYVRVCDAYGSGWFYIPGTETCLKFDGDVRVQYETAHRHVDTVDETSLHDADYRARLNVRANNETEYGTLSSRIRFVASGGAGTKTGPGGGHNDEISGAEGRGDAPTVVDVAQISLAGFRVGYNDDYFSHFGYYNARYDGVYAYDEGLFAEYTYAANGLSLTVGAVDGNATGEAGAPDMYVRVSYETGGLTLFGAVINDSSEGEIAYALRADYDFGNGFQFAGWYDADDGVTDYVKGHMYGVTAQYSLTESMVLFAGYGQYADQYEEPTAVDTSTANYTVGLAWTPVSGLLIQPEYQSVWGPGAAVNSNDGNFGQFSLRIVRSF